MDLIHISGGTYFVPGGTSIGVHIEDNECYLIDTGIDENQIRKVYNYLKEKGISIAGVINTHSHADHTGGNKFLEKKGVNNFYASKMEGIFINYPILLTSFMFGSIPPKFMMTKMLMPEAIEKTVINEFPEKFKILDLPGHSWGMVGIVTPDNVFFCADSIYSEKIVEKHPLLFHIKTDYFLDTMKKIEGMSFDYFVLSHGGINRNISNIVEKNIGSIEKIISFILENIPSKYEELYSKLLEEIKITSEWEYYLNRIPFNSIITHLSSIGKIRILLKGNNIYLDKV
ncbi:MAG: MBL fold metallo-hydrolase [Euryarchaeota archaeon]|nr:MBL fold metallo-hydrolase [Euryarchaeota archaeon]